jgi:hypothetical protein
MVCSELGRAVILALDKAVEDRRAKGLSTVMIGSYCSVDILGDFYRSSNRPTNPLQFKENGIRGGHVVDITLPGSSTQRAVLANDRPRWIMDANIRRLKQALRARPDHERSKELSSLLIPWDIDGLPIRFQESLRKSLETPFWSRGLVQEVVLSVYGVTDLGELKLEDFADSIRPDNPGNVEDSPADITHTSVDEKLADIAENGTDFEKDLARGVVKKGKLV